MIFLVGLGQFLTNQRSFCGIREMSKLLVFSLKAIICEMLKFIREMSKIIREISKRVLYGTGEAVFEQIGYLIMCCCRR